MMPGTSQREVRTFRGQSLLFGIEVESQDTSLLPFPRPVFQLRLMPRISNADSELCVEYLPLWAQFPQNSLGKLDELFEEVGFAEVGNFELSLTQYANEQRRRWRSDWGIQKWRQWVLRTGNWERGRRS